MLHELTVRSLLTPSGADTWTMHDVVRDHARTLLADLDDELTQPAVDRLLDHYLIRAAGADRTLNPSRWRYDTVLHERAEDYVLGDRAEALAWWQAEGETVVALVRLAHETGRHATVVSFADTCKMWLSTVRPYAAWTEITDRALSSARALEAPEAEAFVLLLRCPRLMATHEFVDAEASAANALATYRELDHLRGVGSSYECLAQATTAQDRPHDALPLHLEAIAAHERIGRPRGLALQRRFYAQTLARVGRFGEARDMFAQALRVFEDHNDEYQAVQTLTWRVPALIGVEELDAAADSAAAALRRARTAGNEHQAARALVALADVEAARGNTDSERQHLTEAAELYSALRAPEAAEITDRLNRR